MPAGLVLFLYLLMDQNSGLRNKKRSTRQPGLAKTT